jgi:hypothetical protein
MGNDFTLTIKQVIKDLYFFNEIIKVIDFVINILIKVIYNSTINFLRLNIFKFKKLKKS